MEAAPISQAKDISDIIKNIFEVGAIITGGIWAYMLFISQRQRFPSVKISHRISHRSIGADRLLLNVEVDICNDGKILLGIPSLTTRIRRVKPVDYGLLQHIDQGHEIVPDRRMNVEWPVIKEKKLEWKVVIYELEPGEYEQFHYDFIVDKNVETLQVFTFLPNRLKADRGIGWRCFSTYDL
jgi:hypothetical protein